MRRIILMPLVVALVLTSLVGIWTTLVQAQDAATRSPDDTVGITTSVLGSLASEAAPGYRLELARSELAPDSSVDVQTSQGARVSCVESGSVAVSIQKGAATVIRTHVAGAHIPAETVTPHQPFALEPGDCVALSMGAVYTVQSPSDSDSGRVVLWEAHLSKFGD